MRAACVRALALMCAALAPSAAAAETFVWLQHGPHGLEARAVTDQSTCPTAARDGAPAAMLVRATPGGGFPVTACALALAGAKSAAIDEVPLPVTAAEPRHILVIGDTGCRLKGSYIQACNDPVEWPFRLIAEVAAHRKPDLVIHVGDYHYRETPCPPGVGGCAGSPHGDNWPVWRADFFSPAETLLRIAPWLFVRGNHEECSRGGHGWTRALAPGAFETEAGCDPPERPFVVRLPGLTLAVVDVSSASESMVDAAQAEEFRRQYAGLAQASSDPIWILQHRPIWSPGGVFAGKLVGDNKTLAVAAQDSIPPNVAMILSGHHHLFQVLTYATGQPVQVVIGHGGDSLNAAAELEPAGWTFGRVTVASGINEPGRFGFAMFEKQGDGWLLTDYDKLGNALRACTIIGRAAICP